MTTNVMDSPLDGQWLDFYALLEVPVDADEATIRRRVGRVYTDASANAEHRDLQKRMWYQSLCEQVLPQARRVLLDAGWRAKYDRQHILHSIGDPSAQPFVAFIASMRGGEISNLPDSDLSQLPTLVQEEILAARGVVECARAGLQLDLLPSQAVKPSYSSSSPPATVRASAAPPVAKPRPKAEVKPAVEEELVLPTRRKVAEASPAPKGVVAPARTEPPVPAPEAFRSKARRGEEHLASEEVASPTAIRPRVPAPLESQKGEPARLKMLTAQEASEIRRQRRTNSPDYEPFVSPETLHKINGDVVVPARPKRKVTVSPSSSRVVVGDDGSSRAKLSPATLHLLVAITGVLLTLSIQRFAATPAVATGSGRMPILIATSPEMASVLDRVQTRWEASPEGQNFDIVVQDTEGEAGVRRVLGHGGNAPDAWMPSSKAWLDRYNTLAPKSGHELLSASESVAGTPVVLIARGAHAGELRRRWPDHRIPSWSALRSALATGAPGHFGLSDPQQTAVGALARFSMAREWGESHGQTPAAAVRAGAFWEWMKGFESQTPSAYSTTSDLMNDLLGGNGSRLWWGLAYESDAIGALNAGQNIEMWVLPRTILADHPFTNIERVGAPVEVSAARATFERFLRSDEGQKNLLLAGMRPARLGLSARVKGNPFTNADFGKRGLSASLPRDERSGAGILASLSGEWAKRFK